ncbi:NUDIX domain-containing protein [Patescibacteria group bacterium]|nr:NUDIX domain-containing protein [Patescibacteria group bacterium]MCL5410079.1 NUDIX domain-containing protein [Patescibacteria group bacterium]
MEKVDTNQTVIALIVDHTRENVLVEKRAESSSFMPGEEIFPGGKIEATEIARPFLALQREVLEELGLRVEQAKHLNTVIYGEGGRLLQLFVISQWQGEIPSQILDQGNPVYWTSIQQLKEKSSVLSMKKIAQELARHLQNL